MKQQRQRRALLRAGETRSLLCLLELALRERDTARYLAAAAACWPVGRLQEATASLSVRLGEGECLSAALEGLVSESLRAVLSSGESAGRPLEGVTRALEILERGDRARSLVLVPLFSPLLALTLGSALCGLLFWLALPTYAELRGELALLMGTAAPSALLSFAAEHGTLGGLSFFMLALLPVVLPAVLQLASRSARGASLLLRLPLLGQLARSRAGAEFGGTLESMLRAGATEEEAFALAAESVSNRSLKRSLRSARARMAAGEPLHEVLPAAGLGVEAGRSFAPALVVGDGGVTAAARLAAISDETHQLAMARCGRLAVSLAYCGVAVLVLGLMRMVFLPLLSLGSL